MRRWYWCSLSRWILRSRIALFFGRGGGEGRRLARGLVINGWIDGCRWVGEWVSGWREVGGLSSNQPVSLRYFMVQEAERKQEMGTRC